MEKQPLLDTSIVSSSSTSANVTSKGASDTPSLSEYNTDYRRFYNYVDEKVENVDKQKRRGYQRPKDSYYSNFSYDVDGRDKISSTSEDSLGSRGSRDKSELYMELYGCLPHVAMKEPSPKNFEYNVRPPAVPGWTKLPKQDLSEEGTKNSQSKAANPNPNPNPWTFLEQMFNVQNKGSAESDDEDYLDHDFLAYFDSPDSDSDNADANSNSDSDEYLKWKVDSNDADEYKTMSQSNGSASSLGKGRHPGSSLSSDNTSHTTNQPNTLWALDDVEFGSDVSNFMCNIPGFETLVSMFSPKRNSE